MAGSSKKEKELMGPGNMRLWEGRGGHRQKRIMGGGINGNGKKYNKNKLLKKEKKRRWSWRCTA